MSLKDNFYQAIRELLDHSGLVGSDLTAKAKEKPSELDSYLETPTPKKEARKADFQVPEADFNAPDLPSWQPPESAARVEPAEPRRRLEPAEPRKRPEPVRPAPEYDIPQEPLTYQEQTEMTVISRNTLVLGDIRSFAGISIEGSVKGQVDVMKDAYLSGKLLGGLRCNNASMHGSSLQGDTRAKGNVQVDNNSMLLGNLNAQHAEVDGKVKGNLEISGKVEVDSNAVILGDVTTSTLTVMDGANIKGFVNTSYMTEEAERVFPGQITISEEEELSNMDL